MAKRVTVKGQRMVMLEEQEFDRLLHKADEWEPLLPAPDADGNYPVLEYSRVSLARKMIRRNIATGSRPDASGPGPRGHSSRVT